MDAIKKLLFLIVVIGVATIACFYFLQEKMLFIRQPVSQERLAYIRNTYPTNIEEISIMTPDNIELHGWLVKNSPYKKSPLIIYFGGNAEEVSWQIENAFKIDNWSMALINYRGYGLSQGKPGQKHLYNDAVEIYDYFSQRNDIDAGQIAVMGRSLGTGVAIHLAKERDLKGIILISPYDSIANVAKETFPSILVSNLLKHPFNVVEIAHDLKVPLLAITASEDRVISQERSQKLIESWGGNYFWHVIQDRGHNDLHYDGSFIKKINEFLLSLT
ncbi:MAG: alpha/beta hydrolase [Clostridia bacterium]|nr:alpha/beta hydrolase [Clostridia bacterium]